MEILIVSEIFIALKKVLLKKKRRRKSKKSRLNANFELFLNKMRARKSLSPRLAMEHIFHNGGQGEKWNQPRNTLMQSPEPAGKKENRAAHHEKKQKLTTFFIILRKA